MLRHPSVLVTLVRLVDRLPWPAEPVKPSRGRPQTYSDRLIVKALVIMIIRRLYTAYAFLAFLDQDDPLPQQLRPLLSEHGRFPTRRTWERRLAALPQRLPGLIGCVGRSLVRLLQPWATQGRLWRSIVHPWKRVEASGTKNIGSRASSRIPRLIRRPGGANRAGMAGGMGGSCTSLSP